MPIVRFLPDGKEVRAKEGSTLLQTALRGRVSLRHRCGGKASCTTCKVMVHDPRGLGKASEKEERMLGVGQLKQGYRLACQARVYGDVKVQVPEDPLKAVIRKKLLEQESWED